jgi:hypothetical protein
VTIIFVHGWATDPQQAIDNYNDIAPAPSSKGFVTIFSWILIISLLSKIVSASLRQDILLKLLQIKMLEISKVYF